MRTGVLALTFAATIVASLLVAGAAPAQTPARSTLPPSAIAGRPDGPPRFVADEVLVKYRNGSADEFFSPAARRHRQDLHRRHGSRSLWESGPRRIEHVRLRPGLDVADAVRLYQHDPMVEYAEPNYLVSASATVDDPLFAAQWALRNTGQTGGTPGADIRMTQAWDVATGSAQTVVAVLDSGTDLGHEDIAANLWVNTGEVPGDGLDNDQNGYTDDVHGIDAFSAPSTPVNLTDDHGHGTHVAGSIGASTNNGLGIAGMNWSIQILTCKFLDQNGSGATAGAIRCLEYVRTLRDRGVNIVATNNSWGGGAYSQLLLEAIAAQHGILFVAAAGNNGADNDTTPFYPASYPLPNVLVVSASDHTDTRPSWSNFGRTTVAISAPGVDIVSLRAAGTDVYRDGLHFVPEGDASAKYYRASGTSMAAPHVTGLVALLRSHDPSLDWRGTRNLILAGADVVTSLDSQTMTGRRLNAFAALTCTDGPLLTLWGPAPAFPIAAGTSATFSVLSVNCRAPAGPVWATTADGLRVELLDDGVAPDLAGGDGVFTATASLASETAYVTFASVAGSLAAPYTSIGKYLPVANVGFAYRRALEHVGATTPSTWTILAGALPGGLALEPSTGIISGMPLVAGSTSFRVRAVDALGRSSSEVLTLFVSGGDVIESISTLGASGLTAVPQALAVDAAGNTIVAGYFVDPATGRENFVTRKYDPAGQELWSRYRADTTTPIYKWAQGVAVDSAGAIYVTGGGLRFGNSDFILVKYDASGNEVWVRTHDTGASEVPFGLTVDRNDDVIVVGARFTGTGVGASAMYTVKFDSSGAVLWSREHQPGVFDRAFDVAVDGDANVYVAGGTGSVYVQGSGVTQLTYALVTVKYDAAGEVQWTRTDANPGLQLHDARAIAVDRDGNSYVGGWFNGSRTIYKYDTMGGLIWSTVFFPGTQYPNVDDLAIDARGHLIVAGASFDLATSRWRYYLAKLSPDGTPEWTTDVDGDFRDSAIDIAVDSKGFIHVGRPFGTEILVSTYLELLRVPEETLPDGLRGSAYSHRIEARGGYPPFVWRVTDGALPPGLALDPATGEIQGTPTDGGTFDFTVSVEGPYVPAAERQFNLDVAFVRITTLGIDAIGVVGGPYRTTLTAEGIAAPFRWRIVSGELPPGLRLGAMTGMITGVPTTPGVYEFVLEVEDREGHTAQAALLIEVHAPVSFVKLHMPDGVVDVAYEASLAATGGVEPYYWMIEKGSLPDGLSLDPSTGVVSGTPTTAGTSHFTATVFDAYGLSASRTLTLVVHAPR